MFRPLGVVAFGLGIIHFYFLFCDFHNEHSSFQFYGGEVIYIHVHVS